MRKRLRILGLAIFVAAPLLLTPLQGSGALAGLFNPETFRLANGMRVVVVPNHRIPVVTHMVWYKVGSADEPPGKSGIAHFLEHLMFKGTKKLAPGEFSRIVARNGGRENAFTSHDYTAYYQTVAVERLQMVMQMEADRMINLVLTEKVIEPERSVILEERRQRTDNNPAAILREHISAALYLNHPYRKPIIGWDHEIRELKLKDILGFYKRWYGPENAILVVAGDITADELKPLAEKTFGLIPPVFAEAGQRAARSRPSEPPQSAERRIFLRDARVRQPSWSRQFLAPSYLFGLAGGGASDQAYALQVLAEVLGGGATSPFYRSLVVERKLAVSAGASYNPDGLGPGRFVLYASPRPGVGMAALEAAMEEELGEYLEKGVSLDEVSRAKRHLRAAAVYARDSIRTGAQVLGVALATGLGVEDVETWPQRIGAVTVDEINAALRMVIAPGRSVTALLLPEKDD